MIPLLTAARVALDPGTDDHPDHMDGEWGNGMMGWGGAGLMPGWMVLGLLVLVLVTVALAVIIALVVSRRNPTGGASTPAIDATRTPREIIDHRLASGEITVKEHRALAAELDGGAAKK
jgi:uncharacterized membrane protein